MHAEDAAGVLAGRPGLAAEAAGVAGVAQGQLGLVEDLVHVQRRQRHLGGAHQVEAVRLDPVDLLHVGGEEAGAVHGLVAHQHRHDHRAEALAGQLLQRVLHEGELQEHQVALEVGEAAPRGPGAALHVDEVEGAARSRWSLGGKANCRGSPHVCMTTESSSPPAGADGSGRLGTCSSSSSSAASIVFEPGLQVLDLFAHRAHGFDLGRRVLLVALGLGDLLAHRVPQAPPLLHRHQELPPRPVELQQRVESGFGMRAAAAQGGADHVGLVPDQLDVEHRHSPRVWEA